MTFSTGLLYEIEASGKEELEKKRLKILEQTVKEVKRVFNTGRITFKDN